jgi:hypothetical protein
MALNLSKEASPLPKPLAGSSVMRTLLILGLALGGLPGTTSAQDVASEAPSYCPELKRIVALAMTRERFASIAGKPRDGNFVDTSLALTGWKDCSLYGRTTYTCDSQDLGSAHDAEQAQAGMLHDIKACLGETWTEAEDRSSSDYVVLHSAAWPISITLSTDETDKHRHVFHLILFLRRN